MNIDKDYSFTVSDENGNDVICDTLSVVNIEGENPIIIYTDYSIDEDGKFNLYASKVIKEDENMKLEKIDDITILPEIQKEMEKVLNSIHANI